MGTSKSQPNDWMTKDGTGKITTFADERGWCIQHADGQVEVIHAMSDVAESPAVAAAILSVTNPSGDYSLGAGAEVLFTVQWSEPVTVTGTPQIAFEENGAGVTADYDSTRSDANTSVFVFDVTAEGAIDTVTEAVQLNGGTIVGADAIAAVLDDAVFTNDTVASVAVTSGGSGYDETETITFDAPNKANSTATITTTDNAGAVDSVTLEDGGYGYEDGVIAIAGGTAGTVTATTVDGVITEIVLLAGGSGYTGATGVELDAPTLTVSTATGTVVFATTDVPTDEGIIAEVVLEDGGYGYASGTIAIDGGTAGTVTATVVDGVITEAVLLAGGSGYSGTTGVDLADPTIANATATFTTTETGGVLDTIAMVTGGYGYEAGTYPIPGGNADGTVTLTVVDGIVTVMTLVDAGTGYTAGVGLDFSAPTLVNSIATVTLKYKSGSVESITMTANGYGYDGLEEFTLEDPDGTDALLAFDGDYAQPTDANVVA